MEPVEQLAMAETAISNVARTRHEEWQWARYAQPSAGGPFLWNDIIITTGDGISPKRTVKYTIQASEYIKKYDHREAGN